MNAGVEGASEAAGLSASGDDGVEGTNDARGSLCVETTGRSSLFSSGLKNEAGGVTAGASGFGLDSLLAIGGIGVVVVFSAGAGAGVDATAGRAASGLYVACGSAAASCSDGVWVGYGAGAGAAGFCACASRLPSSSSKSFDGATFCDCGSAPGSPAAPLRRRRPPRRPRRRERNSSRVPAVSEADSCGVEVSAAAAAARSAFGDVAAGCTVATGAVTDAGDFASAGARCGCGCCGAG